MLKIKFFQNVRLLLYNCTRGIKLRQVAQLFLSSTNNTRHRVLRSQYLP